MRKSIPRQDSTYAQTQDSSVLEYLGNRGEQAERESVMGRGWVSTNTAPTGLTLLPCRRWIVGQQEGSREASKEATTISRRKLIGAWSRGDLGGYSWKSRSNGTCQRTGIRHRGVVAEKGNLRVAPRQWGRLQEQQVWVGKSGFLFAYCCDVQQFSRENMNVTSSVGVQRNQD